MFLPVGLDATIEQTVVPDPVHLDVVLVEQPQLPPDAFSVCAVFGVRVLAEEKTPRIISALSKSLTKKTSL